MKAKLFNLFLILSSLLGYLEWGKNQSMFLFEMEATVFQKIFTNPQSVIHPFIILPLVGQIILLITLFQRHPNRWLTYLAIAGLGLLLGFMFFVGCLGLNLKIMVSCLPFLVLAILTIIYTRRQYKTIEP